MAFWPGPSSPGCWSVSSVTCWEDEDWLEMISVIGPAPNLWGETTTVLSLIAALTTMGVGGRSALAYLWSLSPHEARAHAPVIAQAATAALRGVLRIAGLWLLILDPDHRSTHRAGG